MVKLTIGKDDIELVRGKYGAANAVAGYLEEAKLIKFPLPKYYVVVIDDENLTMVQMDMKFKEKSVEVFPLSSVSNVEVASLMATRISFDAKGHTFKLLSRPVSVGFGEEQKQLLSRFESMVG